ncbi:MAG: orotidine-5'-phosphate decarboxylase [Deltaproteobacteria bacterium]|nr:orotidine-5'-phosphate decarboxylase [Deltaproteobacteria bacterium]
MNQTELIVALDFPNDTTAWNLVQTLKNYPVIYKVGLELYLSAGSAFVKKLKENKNRAFLDLKFYDIPNTVAKAAQQVALLKADMFTAHLSGGEKMFGAIKEELKHLPAPIPKTLGVSVLTSFDEREWNTQTIALSGSASSISESVIRLIEKADLWGVDGVVCSAHELIHIRKKYPNLYLVIPGIRPEGSVTHDQARIMTPKQASQEGANAIVIGRPITQTHDPAKITEQVLRDIGQ